MLDEEGHGRDGVLGFLVRWVDKETLGQSEMTRAKGMDTCCSHDCRINLMVVVVSRRW